MQLPRELLGLVMRELREEAVLKAELAEGAVLMWEEEVDRVVKKAPFVPSFRDETVLSRLIVFFFVLMDHLRGFPLWFPEDEFFALLGGLGL